MNALSAVTSRRVRVRVTGTVQGVGFRPYVYRLAGELGLSGFVLNDAHGVLLEVQGGGPAIERFLERLEREAPPLAVLEQTQAAERQPVGASGGFEILASPRGQTADAAVTPDTATCDQCLQELFDPADRRYRYPFINCTNCGPRFTIVRGVPYDRPLTTMAAFRMCPECRREYEDPADRRFHAQPNACPACGPSASLLHADGTGVRGDPLQEAALALRDGAIVAIKGLGGYHLACRADDERAVAALRARKHREDKPFALMAADAVQARGLVALDEAAEALLSSPARPIVLAPRLTDAPVAAAVAPGASEFGVMLPYSPLHHLLLGDVGQTLVMTSGNVSDEPIAYLDEDALSRLAGLADLLLIHDRPIETRTDDSVLRTVAVGGRDRPALLRRSRGYVPASIALPGGTPVPILACGAELKNTFCLAKGNRAWISHHIGDLENYETLRSFTEGIEHLGRLFAVDPEVVVHDLHPDYLSTKHALERSETELVGVQHHHAHLAACLAEHGVVDPAIGAIFDGTGYGPDGTVWGGELLVGDLLDFERVGKLLPVPLPGGERAIRQPWRMACSWITAALGETPPLPPRSLVTSVPARDWERVGSLVGSGLRSPLTSSMGRLFDAVAALCGIRPTVNYEGQAAIELERACEDSAGDAYPFPVAGGVLDPRETILAVLADLDRGTSPGVIAARFHHAVSNATVTAVADTARQRRMDLVVISGGVFQNRRLLTLVAAGLEAEGLRVLIPEQLPVNDGGISYGQAAIAAARLRAR